jgi:prenyl protein peptidase
MYFAILKHQSFSASIALAFGFVFSLYIWKDSARMDRNHPIQIKRRLVSVAIVSALSPLLLIYWAKKDPLGLFDYPTFLDWVGFPVSIGMHKQILAALAPVFLTFVLFIGPHVVSFVYSWGRKQFRTSVIQQLVTWVHEGLTETRQYNTELMILRNLVVGPMAEEWVFRGCMLPLLISGKFLPYQAALISPGLFGLCHVHHLLNRVLNENHTVTEALTAVCKLLSQILQLISAFQSSNSSTLLYSDTSQASCS